MNNRQETSGEILQSKRPAKKIDKIVRGVMIYWVVFVAIAWITYWVKDSVPDTLIQYGLGGGTVELIVSGIIEITRDGWSFFIEKARDKLDKKEDNI